MNRSDTNFITIRIPDRLSHELDCLCETTGIVKWRLTADMIKVGLRQKYPNSVHGETGNEERRVRQNMAEVSR
jgi:hypothetical protein